MYLYFSVGMYIITVLPHSDSCLYWCLAYIRKGISDLCIYVAVISSYPRDRGVTDLKINDYWWWPVYQIACMAQLFCLKSFWHVSLYSDTVGTLCKYLPLLFYSILVIIEYLASVRCLYLSIKLWILWRYTRLHCRTSRLSPFTLFDSPP